MTGSVTDFVVVAGSACGLALIGSTFFAATVAGGDLVCADGITIGALLITTGIAAFAIGVANGFSSTKAVPWCRLYAISLCFRRRIATNA
jgi:hypothetical protein